MTSNIWKTFNEEPCSQECYIEEITELYGKSLLGDRVQQAINWFHTEMKEKNEREIRKNINKLSFRHRCKATPSLDDIREREKRYVNDAIITEKKRTKYKDIIPVYDASNDTNCKTYFNRPDVKRLLSITCSPRK